VECGRVRPENERSPADDCAEEADIINRRRNVQLNPYFRLGMPGLRLNVEGGFFF